MNTIKSKIYYYIINGGDGSAIPRFFSSKEKRDRYMKFEENTDCPFTEADGETDIELDMNGNIIPDARPYSGWDDIHYDDPENKEDE